MTQSFNTLPLTITKEIQNNPYIMGGLAQRAFQLANYDMTPANPVEDAISKGLIIVEVESESDSNHTEASYRG